MRWHTLQVFISLVTGFFFMNPGALGETSKPCESLQVQNKIFCFESKSFYLAETPVVVALDGEESDNLRLQIFAFKDQNGKFQFTQVASEDGLGLRHLPIYGSKGLMPYYLQDLNNDGQMDLVFGSTGQPNNQVLIVNFDKLSHSLRFLQFINLAPSLGEDNTFDFNFVTPPSETQLPFLSASGELTLPLKCNSQGGSKTSPCEVGRYKSAHRADGNLVLEQKK